MSIADTPRAELPDRILAGTDTGPVTKRHKRSAAAFYLTLFVVGVVAAALGSPTIAALGTGLLAPGLGFLAVGGWYLLAIPLTLLLFALALVAWFGSGMAIAPVLVWAGAAGLAAWAAGSEVWMPGVWAAPVLVLIFVLTVAVLTKRRKSDAVARRTQREEFLPAVIGEVRNRAASADFERAESREASRDLLGHVQNTLDIALSPNDDFSRFDMIDQFQTASVRYQINQCGYTLAMYQREFAPNFAGYLGEAQRGLVERYLERKVWNYWKYENAWGNLRFNADPAVKDNIMLTGFYGLHVALYSGVTGDGRYDQPGALTFGRNEKKQYPHSLSSLIGSIRENFESRDFTLYPCEPNWIYTGCNFRGITALAAYDRFAGTNYSGLIKDQFRDQLSSEFMTPDGGVVALRSSLTGLSVPFPVPDSSLIMGLGAVYPKIGEQYWAFVRKEILEGNDGITIPVENGVDFGNYRMNRYAMLPYLLIGAKELGDHEISDRVMEVLDAEARVAPTESGAVRYDVSVLTDSTILMGRLMRRASWEELITAPTPDSALTGPLLGDVAYPDVLVAAARSDGADLTMVLHPAVRPGRQQLNFERLRPGARYDLSVQGIRTEEVVADGRGRASAAATLNGRTDVRLTPAS
ncbi:linalool dehydratase/isomerase domain-containing protein [Gordonia terrae]